MIFETKNIICHCLYVFPIYLPWRDGTGCHDLHFFECWVLRQFFHAPLTFIKRLFSSSSLSAIRVVSSTYVRLLIFLLATLISACASSSPAFHMMYSVYKLNKQGDNIQPWYTPFPIWNQSVVLSGSDCCFLTCIQISQDAGQVIWYSHLLKNFPQCVVIYTVKGFSIVNEAEVDFFFWNFLAFSVIQGCWQFDLWFLCLF